MARKPRRRPPAAALVALVAYAKGGGDAAALARDVSSWHGVSKLWSLVDDLYTLKDSTRSQSLGKA